MKKCLTNTKVFQATTLTFTFRSYTESRSPVVPWLATRNRVAREDNRTITMNISGINVPTVSIGKFVFTPQKFDFGDETVCVSSNYVFLWRGILQDSQATFWNRFYKVFLRFVLSALPVKNTHYDIKIY